MTGSELSGIRSDGILEGQTAEEFCNSYRKPALQGRQGEGLPPVSGKSWAKLGGLVARGRRPVP